MNRTAQFKIVLILLLSVILRFSAQSQSRQYFIINGKISPELNSNLAGNSTIQIIKNDQKAVSFQIPDNDRFRLELEYNAEYQLTFTKKGNLPKTIIVNTDVPEKSTIGSSNFPHFLMTVKLFVDNQNPANLYSGTHVQRICYSSQTDCFERVPTILDVEYVEKGNSNQSTKIQSQENKVKLREYQVF